MAEANVKARRVQIQKLIKAFLCAQNDPQNEQKLKAALEQVPKEELYDVLIDGYFNNRSDWIANQLKKLLSWIKSRVGEDNHTGHHNTMIHCAVREGDTGIFGIILSILPIDEAAKLLMVPNILNEYTPLHYAVRNRDLQAIKDMKEKVGSENWLKVLQVKDSKGSTPVHMAIDTELDNVIKEMLCDLESEKIVCILKIPNLKSQQGLTAFQLATTKNNKALLKKITQGLSKSEVHELASAQTTGTLNTSLHLAATFNCPHTIQFLYLNTPQARRRVMFDETNSQPQTSLEIAKSLKHREAINEIQHHMDILEDEAEQENIEGQPDAFGNRRMLAQANNHRDVLPVENIVDNIDYHTPENQPVPPLEPVGVPPDEARQGNIEGRPGAYGNIVMEGHANCVRDRLSFQNEVDNIDYHTPEKTHHYPVELVAVPPARICHPES